ncbi:hypothetical protein WMF15_12320 [Sorangium sp. So ce233]
MSGRACGAGAVVLAGEAKPVAGGVVFEAELAGDVDERHLVGLVHDEEDPPFGIERVEHLGRELQPLSLREVLLAARRGVDRLALRHQVQSGRHLAAAVGAVQVMADLVQCDPDHPSGFRAAPPALALQAWRVGGGGSLAMRRGPVGVETVEALVRREQNLLQQVIDVGLGDPQEPQQPGENLRRGSVNGIPDVVAGSAHT